MRALVAVVSWSSALWWSSLEDERTRVADLAAVAPDVCRDRVLFFVKEPVYKAWFPLTQRWLGFEEVRVDFDPAGRLFTARLLVPGSVANGRVLTGFTGRWLVSHRRARPAGTTCPPGPLAAMSY
jgi:4'-phosphopantetheinyl transferase EntD